MEIIEAIKNVVRLSPSRGARIFFECIISKIDNKLSVKFYPTNKWTYFLITDLEKYPGSDRADHQEIWHQTGLAIGSLEHFLKTNNYFFSVSNIINQEYIEVTVNV